MCVKSQCNKANANRVDRSSDHFCPCARSFHIERETLLDTVTSVTVLAKHHSPLCH